MSDQNGHIRIESAFLCIYCSSSDVVESDIRSVYLFFPLNPYSIEVWKTKVNNMAMRCVCKGEFIGCEVAIESNAN